MSPPVTVSSCNGRNCLLIYVVLDCDQLMLLGML